MKSSARPYQERFPVGSVVRIADRAALEVFAREWRWHHPLDADRFRFAGTDAEVEAVGFYHGGDVLYTLKRLPGMWHEACLGPADIKSDV